MSINSSDNIYQSANPLERAVILKRELDSLRPLDGEKEARIMQKFRLDWNYHSNNLEGNSLTYGETKALLLFGVTAQGKPLKDHFEVTGHNEAINWVIDLVKGERPLSEVFIRELHSLLLKESHYKEALTPGGQKTRRKIEVGKYKSQPNHVITITGEPFYFATPEETPARMEELVNWYRKERERDDVNPIILAAEFHYRFIRIHPFDDGNGRVARILMNFILMQFGYPPVIIKTEDKENYYRVLTLADAGQITPFIEYIADNLNRSLEIMISGAKGESIEEPDDLDKELALLEKRVRNIGRKIEVRRSTEAIRKVFDESIYKVVFKFIESGRKFSHFYFTESFQLFLNDKKVLGEFDNVIHYARQEMDNSPDTIYSEIKIIYLYETFNQSELGIFNYISTIEFKFGVAGYKVLGYEGLSSPSDGSIVLYDKLYDEELTDEEINALLKSLNIQHMEYIEKRLKGYESSQSQ